MVMIFGKPLILLYGQLMLGLINGAFYALLSLGLAVIFGLLNIINFAHGALFMLGAFVAWGLLQYLGIGYWAALVLAPIILGAFGVVLERVLIKRLARARPPVRAAADVRLRAGHRGPDAQPVRQFRRAVSRSRRRCRGRSISASWCCRAIAAWVVLAAAAMCLVTWLLIDKTRLGATLRAATENAALVQAFGVNVPRLITLTYGGGVALAAFAGVLAAPMNSVNPNMGSNLIVVVFATVVIGGMGSILGSIVTGFGLGIIEGLTKVYYPEGSATVVFVVMAIVLLVRPAGLFGRAA